MDSEGFPFDLKFHFLGKFFIQLINLQYYFYSKYSHPLTLTLYFFSNKSSLLPMNVCKIAEWVTSSIDPDQMCSAASDQNLHYLLRPVFLNT